MHDVLTFLSKLDTFLEVITKAHRTPVEKFEFPHTSNQEYGWNTQPLVRIRIYYMSIKIYSSIWMCVIIVPN